MSSTSKFVAKTGTLFGLLSSKLADTTQSNKSMTNSVMSSLLVFPFLKGAASSIPKGLDDWLALSMNKALVPFTYLEILVAAKQWQCCPNCFWLPFFRFTNSYHHWTAIKHDSYCGVMKYHNGSYYHKKCRNDIMLRNDLYFLLTPIKKWLIKQVLSLEEWCQWI